MIRPSDPVRFSVAARDALRDFATPWCEAHGEPSAALKVTFEPAGSESDEPELHLEFVSGEHPLEPGETLYPGDPFPLRMSHRTGSLLADRVVDFAWSSSEGGARGFLVRTAGPSGSRAPGPPSSALPLSPTAAAPSMGLHGAPAPDVLVQLQGPSQRRSGAPAPASGPDEPLPLEARVRAEIDARVNPLVASHGGRISLREIDERGVANVVMTGGCQGCAAASSTLHDVVTRILRRAVPELMGVEDVTPHAQGQNPWLRAI